MTFSNFTMCSSDTYPAFDEPEAADDDAGVEGGVGVEVGAGVETARVLYPVRISAVAQHTPIKTLLRICMFPWRFDLRC